MSTSPSWSAEVQPSSLCEPGGACVKYLRSSRPVRSHQALDQRHNRAFSPVEVRVTADAVRSTAGSAAAPRGRAQKMSSVGKFQICHLRVRRNSAHSA